MQTFQEYVEAGNQNMGFSHHTNEVLEQPFIMEKKAQLIFRRSLISLRKIAWCNCLWGQRELNSLGSLFQIFCFSWSTLFKSLLSPHVSWKDGVSYRGIQNINWKIEQRIVLFLLLTWSKLSLTSEGVVLSESICVCFHIISSCPTVTEFSLYTKIN